MIWAMCALSRCALEQAGGCAPICRCQRAPLSQRLTRPSTTYGWRVRLVVKCWRKHSRHTKHLFSSPSHGAKDTVMKLCSDEPKDPQDNVVEDDPDTEDEAEPAEKAPSNDIPAPRPSNIEPEIFSPALTGRSTMNHKVFISSGLVQATVEKEFDNAQPAHLELRGHAATFHSGQQLCIRGIRHG